MIEKNMCIALIPAYQPETLLIDLLRDIQKTGMKAIVVDDGSGLAFHDIFKEARNLAVVLTHRVNCGKGRAIKTGLRYIKKHFNAPYIVVTMDADGQHPVEDVLRVLQMALQNPDSLILGSRGFKKNVPLRSQLGNSITRFVYSVSTGLSVHDTQTGLRAFSEKIIPLLDNISGERYEYEMNVLLEFARQKVPIKEVEISTVYINNNTGSHFDTWKDSCRIYKEIFKYSASSLVCFFLDYILYSVLLLFTGSLGTLSLTVSNIAARMVSAVVNFHINRRLVFQSQEGLAKPALQYFILAALILAGNTLVLNLLVDQLGLNQYAAKILTEILFFIVSWSIQHFIIFKRRNPHKRNPHEHDIRKKRSANEKASRSFISMKDGE